MDDGTLADLGTMFACSSRSGRCVRESACIPERILNSKWFTKFRSKLEIQKLYMYSEGLECVFMMSTYSRMSASRQNMCENILFLLCKHVW